jgi:hypothetical protein
VLATAIVGGIFAAAVGAPLAALAASAGALLGLPAAAAPLAAAARALLGPSSSIAERWSLYEFIATADTRAAAAFVFVARAELVWVAFYGAVSGALVAE